ncbi:MAG: bifunctional glutamate N-acetyltransferase/amino-acid acetyltransferase ArgJ [Actinomycetes bacterium]
MTFIQLPKGFRGAGVAAQIKSSGAKDLALLVNDGPLDFGTAVFTTNKVVAAPVTWSKAVVKDNSVTAVVLNSGGANACTGPDGFYDTHSTAEYAGKALDHSSGDIVVCSTGLIGVRLPMDKIYAGIASAVATLSPDSALNIAEAIMTTDSHPKMFNKSYDSGIQLFGTAKGAGMLAPSLATMLCVIATDAVVDPVRATKIFESVVNRTFNRLDSDGCTSTNDTVLFMASGASGVEPSDEDLEEMLRECCNYLTGELVRDAEGHSKIVEIKVINALSEADAVAVGRSCARNNLLKCALHGEDPNWGRVLAAVGTAPAEFNPYTIDVALNGIWVCKASAPGEDRSLVDMTGEHIEILIDLNAGTESATVWTNDLTAMYVHENSSYSS